MDTGKKDYKQILLKILETIGYKDDKDAFINQFSVNTYAQSIIDLIQSLQPGEQDRFKQEMKAAGDNAAQVDEVMKRYFTEEQRKNALQLAAKNAMVNYLETIDDSLMLTQKQKLTELFQTVTSISP